MSSTEGRSVPTDPSRSVPRRFLSALDSSARLEYDTLSDGWILSIGEAEQSHVDLHNPQRVFYEYLSRVAHVIDLIAPPGEPIRAVHLGGGAMTLPRYIAATRTGSQQAVVELARELPDFILAHLPWPPGAAVQVVTGDAREQLAALTTTTATPADVVVLDVFAGADAPPHLRERSFYEEVRGALAPLGVLVVNIGDDPGLRFFQEQVHVLSRPATSGGKPVFEHVWCLTHQSMLRGTEAGNLILVATDRRLDDEWVQHLRSRGPHPAAVLDPWELATWVETL